MEKTSPNQKSGQKAWQIILEAVLAIAFFGMCMFFWRIIRPGVLKNVFAEEYPAETTAAPQGEIEMPVAFSEYNGKITYVSGNTPMPEPEPTFADKLKSNLLTIIIGIVAIAEGAVLFKSKRKAKAEEELIDG